jgi:hypothetical protein
VFILAAKVWCHISWGSEKTIFVLFMNSAISGIYNKGIQEDFVHNKTKFLKLPFSSGFSSLSAEN